MPPKKKRKKQQRKGKTLWIIDAGYLINAQRVVDQDFRFDYLKLRKKIEESGPIWRGYFLNSTPHPPSDQQDAFHTWLRSAEPRGPHLITKLYPLKQIRADSPRCHECNRKVKVTCPGGADHHLVDRQQKGVDVGMATLALIHRKEYKTLLLSSGDGDLLDAVEFLSEHGKRIELAVFSEGVSSELQSRANRIHWLDDIAHKIRSSRSRSPRRPEPS